VKLNALLKLQLAVLAILLSIVSTPKTISATIVHPVVVLDGCPPGTVEMPVHNTVLCCDPNRPMFCNPR
jgi:hypothetical protein